MIEERATVSRIESDRVWVRPFGLETCERCQQGRGCGSGGGVLGRLGRRSRPDMLVQSRLPDVRVGDVVVVGVDETSLVRAALAVYLLPLLTMVLAGVFAHQMLDAGDLLVAAFGLVGLLLGLTGTRMVADRFSGQAGFAPVILRRGGPPVGCSRLV